MGIVDSESFCGWNIHVASTVTQCCRKETNLLFAEIRGYSMNILNWNDNIKKYKKTHKQKNE